MCVVTVKEMNKQSYCLTRNLKDFSCHLTCAKLINHFDLLFPQNFRANQGIDCLTEAYGAWEQDSLTTNRNPSVHLQDPTTIYTADVCNMERNSDAQKIRAHPTQMIPPVLIDPASSLVGTTLRPVTTAH